MFCVRFKGSEAWLGLDGVDIPNGERHWVWEQGFQSSFTNWAKGQPRNQHCAVYEAGSASWKSADCYRPKTYICKRGKNLKGCINYDTMHGNILSFPFRDQSMQTESVSGSRGMCCNRPRKILQMHLPSLLWASKNSENDSEWLINQLIPSVFTV